MGNGMCSRRQKRIFQAIAFLAVAITFIYGALLNYELQKQLKKAEVLAVKYQQHQESLSAQLQVVYEHRSRLEKSLQKERLELKKAREDHLVYKLEAQETLNKGRQDSNTRYNALSVQHQMLKSQHEELRKKHTELQGDHQKLGEDLTESFSQHKEKYVQLQQDKEQEVSKLKESIYNLREENRQLRKAHQDVHTQLQDVKQQHKNLLSEHEQVVMSLDNHKSALAAAQNQVEEFMQLKTALNKVSSLRQLEKSTETTIPKVMPSVSSIQGHLAVQESAMNSQTQEEHKGIVTHSKHVNEGAEHQDTDRPELKADEDTGPPQEAGPTTEHPVEVEDEHKKELEEEEMEQVGKPERLVEDQDQVQEEQEQHRQSEDGHKAAANEEEEREEETNMLQEHKKVRDDPTIKPDIGFKSAYEERMEQQKLAAHKEEQARYLKEHRDLLHQHILQQQQMHNNDLNVERQGRLKAIADREHAQYDNLDQDIVQGEEEQHLQEEGGAYERENHQDEAEEAENTARNANEEQAIDQQPVSRERQDKAAADDVNPADDPNNQGEDEFEEAEQEREENLPDENEEQRQQQDQPEKQEHLVMAGNPDQQEDNVDEQYQEEGEEEVQEDLTEERKREQNGEEPYEENVMGKRIRVERQHEGMQEEPKENHEDNYEEEEEEEEEEEDGGVGAKSKRRAEM
ncbi:PREDICTED: Golgi integral membrane protein 4 [Nanorana parkeri]|uniref:Golgi integral membrane protein 4 n=1 Tax=Nanorana parkeri TaxID=125878 RepID=UPI000854135D|nr:PREDICTED: Golgi integral membrane protein 4 [Nanorana parkeri]